VHPPPGGQGFSVIEEFPGWETDKFGTMTLAVMIRNEEEAPGRTA
jgi:hypothetical protein